jgi:hypothetical protein
MYARGENMTHTLRAALLGPVLLLSGFGLLWAQQDTSAPPDNTKINQRDRNQNEPTADQQKENPDDPELAQ